MFDIVLTPAERALFEALDALGVRYLIVGMGAAERRLIERAGYRRKIAGERASFSVFRVSTTSGSRPIAA